MNDELRDIDFEKISRLVYEQCGINLHLGKKELVKARLGKRLRKEKIGSFADYYRHVTAEGGMDELIAMIDSISTNLTSFFREESHFHKLREVVPSMVAASGNGRHLPRLRIWSAGCSTGEEPYSLAITLKELVDVGEIDLKILATDISTEVLRTAADGVYPKERIKNIPPLLLRKYFQVGQKRWSGHYRVKKEIRDIVRFRRFNLMKTLPVDNPFDIIFCRNVMIYFDKETQKNLIDRYHGCLKEGGYFFVGHTESLTGLKHPFQYIEPSMYRK